MMALRAGVIGTFAAPGIFEVMDILGKSEVMERLAEF
jgi:glutamyl-tRNA synthetase